MAYSYSRDEWNRALEWIKEWCPKEYQVDARKLLKTLGKEGTKKSIEARFERRNMTNSLSESLNSLVAAETLWAGMSPLQRYKLIERLPYVTGSAARTNACIRYIADHMTEFTKPTPTDDRFKNIDDGGIHRLT